ncbi:MAG TPA: DNA replication/repair protein RecF [Lichenihabitans sp.]|nr:DNA replication/repair protein RecF [Lichenihabitans sp.]
MDPRRPHVRRLLLTDFRSYARLDLTLPRANVVLSGQNGAGKTNLLEALSVLTPGRGLRRAELGDCAREGGAGGWAVSVEVETGSDEPPVRLGTGIEPGESARKCRVDRVPVSSASAFADHVRIVWLTPAMDGLFMGPASDRRRFLDRIVLTLDRDHAARVSALERALRNRNRVLEEGRQSGRLDRAWAEAAEHEVATLGVAVAAARHETVARLAALIEASRDDASPFPWADLALQGTIEAMVAEGPAIEAEDRYRALLREARARDAAAGRTSIGPHLSDLFVRHGPKAAEASRSSTGEQKALLVGLVLAQARLVDAMSGIAPLVLLDEIAAHFDLLRRAALFERLEELGAQVFMTGADPALFDDAAGVARFEVVPGAVRPAATPDEP